MNRYDNGRQYCKNHIRTICEIKQTMNNKCVRKMLCLNCCNNNRFGYHNSIKSYYCSKCNIKGCSTCSAFDTFIYNRSNVPTCIRSNVPTCIDTYGHDWLINKHIDLPESINI